THRRDILPHKDTPTAAISPLSLHDALPIYVGRSFPRQQQQPHPVVERILLHGQLLSRRECSQKGDDDKSNQAQESSPEGTTLLRSEETRLNSSHVKISYAVFCLKKKKNQNK